MAKKISHKSKLIQSFDFGSNWLAFSEKKLDANRLVIAKQSLQKLLKIKTLKECSFLDIGCGSGIFSIAAHQMGASKVIGIDINPNSIKSSLENCRRFAPKSKINFKKCSVLHVKKLNELGKFDIVYAWGVLHHTGSMWKAMHNTANQVKPSGTLVVSIYNQHFTSPLWKIIKWSYNRIPRPLQKVMLIFFSGIIYITKLITTKRNPLIKERGMDFWFDVVDWIGGYPYEYTEPNNVISFMANMGFKLQNYIPANVPTGCNEFVFVKQSNNFI